MLHQNIACICTHSLEIEIPIKWTVNWENKWKYPNKKKTLWNRIFLFSAFVEQRKPPSTELRAWSVFLSIDLTKKKFNVVHSLLYPDLGHIHFLFYSIFLFIYFSFVKESCTNNKVQPSLKSIHPTKNEIKWTHRKVKRYKFVPTSCLVVVVGFFDVTIVFVVTIWVCLLHLPNGTKLIHNWVFGTMFSNVCVSYWLVWRCVCQRYKQKRKKTDQMENFNTPNTLNYWTIGAIPSFCPQFIHTRLTVSV